MSNLQNFMITMPPVPVLTGIRATIRTTRGETVTLGFKGVDSEQVHARVRKAATKKFPYGFLYTIREV